MIYASIFLAGGARGEQRGVNEREPVENRSVNSSGEAALNSVAGGRYLGLWLGEQSRV